MMMTIAAIETMFGKLDHEFSEFKAYIKDAVGHTEIHVAEKEMFRKLQHFGRTARECFVEESGTGYQEDNPPLSQDGQPLEFKCDFREAVARFNEIFDFSFIPAMPQRVAAKVSKAVAAFNDQLQAPAAETEGTFLAISADGNFTSVPKRIVCTPIYTAGRLKRSCKMIHTQIV
jgi:hypothetical protein